MNVNFSIDNFGMPVTRLLSKPDEKREDRNGFIFY